MTEQSSYGRERYRRFSLAGNGSAETWLQRRGEHIEIKTKFEVPNAGGSGARDETYQRCAQHGCLGEALPTTGQCFAHSTQAARTEYLGSIPNSNRALCLRGTSISQSLWNEIANSPIFLGGRLRAPITLAGAEIEASIRMDGVAFDHYFQLNTAYILNIIEFKNCQFHSNLSATHSFFSKGAINCVRTTFNHDLDISFSLVENSSFGFQDCEFKRSLNFDGLTGIVTLRNSHVHGSISCKHGKASIFLSDCALLGAFDVSNSELNVVDGDHIDLRHVTQLGPCSIHTLNLRKSTLHSKIHFNISSSNIDLTGTNLKEGGLLLVDKARLRLDQLSLGGPLRVSGKTNELQEQPEILGLLNSDAGQLSLSKVNLSRCSFSGAHGLETLDIDSTVTFARAPFLAGRRQFIADEFAWRNSRHRLMRIGWALDGVHVGLQLPKLPRGTAPPIMLTPLSSSQVESIYRELRRGLEAKSNMPCASDFYFGEMEMRRWGKSHGLADRIFTWGYWALSGYGLRPGRALAAWLTTITIGAAALFAVGFPCCPISPSQALLLSVRAAVPGFSSAAGLGPGGQWIETTLRIIGTPLIALFILSARSIVMRKPGE